MDNYTNRDNLMLIVEPTYNVDLVKKIVTNPRLFPMVINDPSISPEDWNPSWDQIYLLIRDEDNRIYGMFLLYKFINKTFFVHSLLLPEYWGKDISVKAAKAGFKFLEDHSDIKKLVTKVPQVCKEVQEYMAKIGFKKEAHLINAVTFLGKDMDLFLYGYNLTR